MAVALRIAVAVGAGALCALGVAWEAGRWSLQSQKSEIERATQEIIAQSPIARARFARTALGQLDRRWLFPLDVDLRLEAAAAYRLVGQFEAAEHEYRQALRVSDRPEIHIAIGDLLVEMDRIDDALDHYTYAVHFSRRYLDYVQLHRDEVLTRVERWEHQIRTESEPQLPRPRLN